MADLFSVSAPLMIREPDGTKKVIAACYPHAEGVLYFDLYWHLGDPQTHMHVLQGELKGDGPWKIAEHVINVLGCHGTDAELALAFDQWQEYLQTAEDYPPPPLMEAIARKLGAKI